MSGLESGLIFVEQFAERVTDFSSQYGSPNGVSYTASNIVGPPSRFPAYGDFSETFVPKTYGRWWKKSPTSPQVLFPEDEALMGQDFIDVQFHTAVYPYCVTVFQTHQAGCVRRIWAGDAQGNWKCLSENPRQESVDQSQLYSSKPNHMPFLTSVLRIEIDSFLAEYYPEFDAVLLVGSESYPSVDPSVQIGVEGLAKKIMGMGLHRVASDFNIVNNIRQLCFSLQADKHFTQNGTSHLERLPEEIIKAILKHLDLRSMCSIARVSSSFNNACRDPLLFTAVNLKSYWFCVNRSALEWLAVRCHLLQVLDLSWCGGYGKLSATDFSWFIKKVGKNLRILRLENCNFLNNESIYWISATCTSLQELNLRGCRHLEPPAFWHLGRLQHVTRLVLDSTQIELPTLLINLQSMSSIAHLSLAACNRLALGGSLDEVVAWLHRHRPTIRSLDVWRSGHISQYGMESLVGLCYLQELDIGWCGLPPNGHWISQLAYRCKRLQKLFLTAARVVDDTDLISIAQNCPHLMQLDLLGNSYITSLGCSRILEGCRELELLDVSYCGQIQEFHVQDWMEKYPKVSVKRMS